MSAATTRPSSQGNMDELQDLYRELILKHAKAPLNFGPLNNPTHSAEGINPLCGDKLTLRLMVGADDIVTAAAFEGTGCAISVASASMLTDAVTGLNLKESLELADHMLSRLSAPRESAADAPETDTNMLSALEGVRAFPARIKCATLAWKALGHALNVRTGTATTELNQCSDK